jgi:hypothetical protein
LLGAVLGPLQIAGGVFRAIVKYRTGQTSDERRLILRFLVQFPCMVLAFSIAHIYLIKASNRGLITDSQCLIGMVLEIVLLTTGIVLVHRRYKKQDYALLKAGEGNLNEVQARRLRLMEAPPKEREIGMHLDAIERLRVQPFPAAYAAHGGLVFAGLAWIVADAVFRHDTPLFLGSLIAATLVELIAVACTIRRPENYLLHRSIMYLSMLPLMGCVVGYWEFQGVTNAMLTTPPDNWYVMRLLPALECIGYLVPAIFFLAKHRRLTRQS